MRARETCIFFFDVDRPVRPDPDMGPRFLALGNVVSQMCAISSQDTFLQHLVTILYFFADGSVGDENSAPRNKIGLRHKVL